MKKMRLSPLLLMVSLVITTLGSAQGVSTYKLPLQPHLHQTTNPIQRFRQISAVPIDPKNLFRGSRARDKSILWKVHLALQLVKRPELNQRQVQIILDAISFSTPEFFSATNISLAKKIKADDALAVLTRRAFSAFPENQAAELFGRSSGKTEDDILRLYFDLSALPLKKRKASFRNASPNDKSDLWRTHLALFLVKRPELNEWQQETILAAMSLATSEYFAVQANSPAWRARVQEPTRALEEQIITAFSWEDGAKIFATLGDGGESEQSTAVVLKSINYKPLSESGPYKQWSHSQLAQQRVEQLEGACMCSTESSYCPIWRVCRISDCNLTESGCGWLWSYPCNGVCQ